jgi:hypothetical protein
VADPGKNVHQVSVVRHTTLRAPKKAVRLDTADESVTPATYNSQKRVLSVTTSESGLVTGSATLSGGHVIIASGVCSYKGKTYTIRTLVIWTGASALLRSRGIAIEDPATRHRRTPATPPGRTPTTY